MESFRVLRPRHENSHHHISSLVTLLKFGKTKIDFSLSEAFKKSRYKYNETVTRNRYIMGRLISATCYLAQQELPFRGNDESSGSNSRGNYVELLHLLAETDVHLQTATVFSATSNDIQNVLIECTSRVLINEIKKKLQKLNLLLSLWT
jgi:hypothetical protein